MKDKINKTVKDTKTVIENLEQFVQASALLVVAGFSYWALGQINTSKVVYWGVLASLIIIGLRGGVEFVKFLKK